MEGTQNRKRTQTEGDADAAQKRPRAERAADASTMSMESIISQLTLREEARERKDWKEADSIRDTLRAAGVRLDDAAKTWSTKNGRSGSIGMWSQNSDGTRSSRVSVHPLSTEVIAQRVHKRELARRKKDFDTSDRMREELKAQGVILSDKNRTWTTADGRTGSLDGHNVAVHRPHPVMPQQAYQHSAYGSPMMMVQQPAHAAPSMISYVQPRDPTANESTVVNDLIRKSDHARMFGDRNAEAQIANQLHQMEIEIFSTEDLWRSPSGMVGVIGNRPVSHAALGFLVQARDLAARNRNLEMAKAISELIQERGFTLDDTQGTWLSNDGRSGSVLQTQVQVPTAPAAVLPYYEPAPAYAMRQNRQNRWGATSAPQQATAPAAAAVDLDGDIQTIINYREQLRMARDYAGADDIRKALRTRGVDVNDSEKKWSASDGSSGPIKGWGTA